MTGPEEVTPIGVAERVTLGAFLKVCGAAQTGGHAKLLIQSGEVTVNGEVEQRRGRSLRDGDVVAVGGARYRVSHTGG